MDILICSFPETRHLGMHVAKELGAEYTEFIAKDFPDSEYHLKLRKNPKDKAVVIISSMMHEVDNKIVETILAGGIARDYGAKKVFLVATYFPYMRQDKHFEKYDSLSSKKIVRLFSNFDKIITIDPHLHRIKNMKEIYSKAESISTIKIIAEYIKKKFGSDFTIVGPDMESRQWSEPIAKMLNTKVVILKKTRLGDRKVKIAEKNLGKHVIIIDDIISTGKTIAGALEMAHKQGIKNLVCIGVHGVLIDNADKLITKYAELITTNTIPNKYAKIDIAPLIAEHLKMHFR